MKKTALLALLVVLCFTLTAVASDVAEAAKKERARRQAVEKEGKKARVLTNQDVADLKATLAFEVTQSDTEETEPTGMTEVKTLPAGNPPVETAQPQTEQRNEEREQEIQNLKEEREALEQQARDAQQTINEGGGYHTRNIGNQYKAKREAEAKIREIDEKLADKEGEQTEEEQ